MAENGGKRPPVGGDIAKREEAVLDFWNKNDIFKKSEEKPAPKGEFVFYDGPPFATGLPHYGHILAGTIKDIIPRYRTMRGYRVHRRWGWDCHGLPLENEIEKELGLQTKRDIEKLGVGKFNAAARTAVLRYADDWKRIVPRLGRWVDMERDYKTMDWSYTESVWWIFKELHDKGLIYQGFKSMHLCPRCGTTLSNFEVQQGYKDITDFAVTVKLPIEGEENTYLLVWTTTPWTLPGNMAAAVNRDAVYCKVKSQISNLKSDELYVLARDRVEDVFADHSYEIVEEFKGEKLVGKRYTPPFEYYKDAELKGKENAWKIYHAPYVSMEEGTGAVHLAPAFGEEDMELARENDVPLVHHVAESGVFAPEVSDFAGMAVKPKDTKEEPELHMAADIEIIKNLAHRGLLFKKEKVTHSYPLCWRCDTPLLNYAASSWFVKVTDFREELVSENTKIHWVPKEVGERRFGNWLEGARDWAISRSRYWGAPLPVWKNTKTDEHLVLGSIDELKQRTKRSGNRYFLIRHGESEGNTKDALNAVQSTPNPLTEKGKESIQATARELAKQNVALIVHSPLERTRETAELLAKELGLSSGVVIADERLREVTFGEFEGKTIEEYHAFFATARERLTKQPEGGETWADVKRRMSGALYELERTHSDKTIVIVSHNGTLQMLQAGAHGLNVDEAATCIDDRRFALETGEVRALEFVPLPHNEEYELDLHRPYIDKIELVDRDGEKLVRVPEVFDCWFESGSMPYGQYHYPFENTDVFEPKSGWFRSSRGYPADFIAEGMDQTRGWFYSLIVLGVALFNKAPYKNVIVNGTVLAEDGQKMSKRLKNYPDPMEVVTRHGADSVRYYLLSSGVVRGDDFSFSEQGVAEISRKIIIRLSNVLSFYELYQPKAGADGNQQLTTNNPQPTHILDKWILARLSELIQKATEGMENYELDQATRPILDFVDDLSTWYLRRSRDRFKTGGDDKDAALQTTRYVLLELSKVMAPSMPFFAETLFQRVKDADSPESVHLTDWPETRELSGEEELLRRMKRLRELISFALEERTRAGIKVRQPLRRLAIKDEKLKDKEELLALIRDEVNVKEIVFDPIIESDVMLDTNITPELREEGAVREVVRSIQDLRKKEGLQPKDKATLVVATSSEGRAFLEKHGEELGQAATLAGIEFGEAAGDPIRVGDYTFTFTLKHY